MSDLKMKILELQGFSVFHLCPAYSWLELTTNCSKVCYYHRKKAVQTSSSLWNTEMKSLCYNIHCYRKNIINIMLTTLWPASLFAVVKWCTEQFILSHGGFEVPTAVTIRNSPFWDIMLCSLMKVNWHFKGTYFLHLHGWSMKLAWSRHQGELCLLPVSCHYIPVELFCAKSVL